MQELVNSAISANNLMSSLGLIEKNLELSNTYVSSCTLTLFQTGGTDYAQHIGMSQTTFQLFRRACLRLIAGGNDRQLPTQSI